MGLAGAVMVGAGRRGVGGALGAGVRGDQDYMSYPRHFERITMARVLLGEDRTEEALDSLGNLLEAALSEGRIGHEIELRVLLALASERPGPTGEALEHLERALTLAEPEGFVRVFVDEGLPMAALLERVIRSPRDDGSYNSAPQGAPDIYAGRLLEHIALQRRTPATVDRAVVVCLDSSL